MYENKFGNPEWEKALDTDYNPPIPNEQAMLDEIYKRLYYDVGVIDEEAINILLHKYFELRSKYGFEKHLDNSDPKWLEMSKEDVYKNKLFMTCNKSILKVFENYDSEENKKRFPKEYVKYWELKFLFMAKAANPSLGFTYDDYGNFKDYIRKEMITFLKKSGLGIDYDKVKSGFYDKPAVSAEGKKTVTTAKNYNDSQDPKDSKTRFWKDWSLLKKILYVILNMCTYCIPIILHFILVILKKFLKKK